MSLNTGNAILSNAITVDSSYKVGIGTASPSAKLDVYTATNNRIQLGTSAAGSSGEYVGGLYYTSNKLLLESFLVGTGYQPVLLAPNGGNVGIGTTNPDNTYQGLTIYGSNPSLRLKSSSSGSWNWIEFVNSSGTNNFSMGVSQSTPIFALKAGAGLDSPNFVMTSSGNIGIGTNTPGRPLEVSYAGPGIRLRYNADNYMDFESDFMNQVSAGANSWQFQFNGSPLVQINSSGKFLIGATSTTYGSRLAVFNNTSSAPVGVFQNNNNVSGDTCVYFQMNANARNTSSYYLQCFDTIDNMYIYGNGNIVNRNNSYGTLSDAALKENIIDATPKLDDLLQLKVRNFNLIADEDKIKQIGFIAQEFEEVFPTMIDIDGKSGMKTIKTSVLVPMLVKAIQELNQKLQDQQQTINSLINR